MTRGAPATTADLALYGEALARAHHAHFTDLARAAARLLLGRLAQAGVATGLVVDLGCGSGVLSRAVCDAGLSAHGVDASDAMLALARAEAPAATFEQASLWHAAFPPCVAVAAVGEALSYADAGRAPTLAELEARLRAIHAALAPGGILVFDVACRGRSGPTGLRTKTMALGDVVLEVEEQEDTYVALASRTITTRVPASAEGRAVELRETHVLRLWEPSQVEDLLRAAGFAAERLARYDDVPLAAGCCGWVATRRDAA